MKGFISILFPLFFAPFFLTACLGEKAPEENLSKKLATDKSQVTDNSIWNEATARSVGFNEEALVKAFDYALADGTYTQAALIIKDNKLVYEKYRGIKAKEISDSSSLIAISNSVLGANFTSDVTDKNTQATSWSMAKSITSVLISIAVEQKYIKSIDDPVSDYLDEWQNNDTADADADAEAKDNTSSSQKTRSKITIRNLLNMRSGLQVVCLKDQTLAYCNPSEPEALAGDNAIIFADNQGDKCLKRPLVANKEGEADVSKFVYSNCDSLLLGMVLEQATGKDLVRFAETELFSKIGVKATDWWRDGSTIPVGGRNLAYCCFDATPRDYAKFGQLIVDNGQWGGKQIVPKWYIEEIKKSAKVNDDSGSYKTSYGLQFWSMFNKQDVNSVVFYAHGMGDQIILMDFDNRMVVVRSGLYQPALNQSDKKIVNVSVESGISFSASVPFDISQVNLEKMKGSSLPLTLPLTVKSNFDFREFYSLIKASIGE